MLLREAAGDTHTSGDTRHVWFNHVLEGFPKCSSDGFPVLWATLKPQGQGDGRKV